MGVIWPEGRQDEDEQAEAEREERLREDRALTKLRLLRVTGRWEEILAEAGDKPDASAE